MLQLIYQPSLRESQGNPAIKERKNQPKYLTRKKKHGADQGIVLGGGDLEDSRMCERPDDKGENCKALEMESMHRELGKGSPRTLPVNKVRMSSIIRIEHCG